MTCAQDRLLEGRSIYSELMNLGPRPGSSSRHPFIWVVRLAAIITLVVFANAAWRLIQDGDTGEFFGWTDGRRGDGWHVANVSPSGPAAAVLAVGDSSGPSRASTGWTG
jgi:hypothetical protein